jgi:hypothetical protein
LAGNLTSCLFISYPALLLLPIVGIAGCAPSPASHLMETSDGGLQLLRLHAELFDKSTWYLFSGFSSWQPLSWAMPLTGLPANISISLLLSHPGCLLFAMQTGLPFAMILGFYGARALGLLVSCSCTRFMTKLDMKAMNICLQAAEKARSYHASQAVMHSHASKSAQLHQITCLNAPASYS